MKINDIKSLITVNVFASDKVTITGTRISSEKLGVILAENCRNIGSTAKVIAKALYFADSLRPDGKPLKKYAKELAGSDMGSAMENGYKPFTVLKRLFSEEKDATGKCIADLTRTIDEECFDSHGIDVYKLSATIINSVDGHDKEDETIVKLVKLLKGHKSATDLKKALAELRDSVKTPESKVIELVDDEAASAPVESPEMVALRAQLKAALEKAAGLSYGVALMIGIATKNALRDLAIAKFVEESDLDIRTIYAEKMGLPIPAAPVESAPAEAPVVEAPAASTQIGAALDAALAA